MPLFKREKDLKMFHMINRELLTRIIDTYINIFKFSLDDTEENIYGESKQKIYFPGVYCSALINNNPPNFMYDNRGYDFNQVIQISFNRQLLMEAELYPEVGDVVEWNSNYYEISNIMENQKIAGQQDNEKYDWSIICDAVLTNNYNTRIDDVKAQYYSNNGRDNIYNV